MILEMKVLNERYGFATYGVPPYEPPPSEVIGPVESPFCERVCKRKSFGILGSGDVESGGFPPLYKWECEWRCKGDQLNPWKVTLDAIEDLANRVQAGTANIGQWIKDDLLPAIQSTNIIPVKENLENFVTNLVSNIGDWLKTNLTDKIPGSSQVANWIMTEFIPAVKSNIENLVLPEIDIRFLFPSLWKPPTF